MIETAIKLAMRNKKALSTNDKAGCYKCLEIFNVSEITSYTDQGETALCPKCNVDSVISASVSGFSKEKLAEIKKYWFE